MCDYIMKNLNQYITEKLLISNKIKKYDPENELDIPVDHLKYIIF